ncbi:MAG: EAL domain-containing protein [Sphingomonadales bacterium]|nr:EAL domain-containing protein [Sphingomonadales bacterium]
MLVCIWIVSVAHARFDNFQSGERQQSEGDSRRASRLLAEFEANGAGWFWETDRNGCLVYLSHKLARMFDKPPEELLGRQLTDLIRAEGGAQDGERTLGFHLSSRSSFSEITVRAAIDGEKECWWSLSGRPIIDEIGQFRGFAGSGTDLTEKRRSDDEVQQLARYDSLTGLANRQHMRTSLEEALGDPEGAARNVTLMLLDLDRFKQVNDTMGHPVGDALLKQVGKRLFRTISDQGMVGRLGGDEFQVMLSGLADNAKRGAVAKSIIEAVSQPYMIDGVTLTIGCSIGIAIAPDHGNTPEELIRNADLALYAAKGDGRGIYRVYETEMHTGAKKRKRLEDDLRNALANDQLHLTYQPVVSTETTKIVGYEALIRWTHPSRGSISPADFIPVAEDIRLIEQIGEWVLRTACEDAASWPIAARVAVNVSPIQFANPNLPKLVTSALAKSGLSPDRLELELTESVFLDETTDTDQMFKALKRTGVRLALDDFGTGYSALGYLKTAPFDKIKIDQSFIRGAAVPGNRNAAIIKAIVALANTLYMETTAEGVELEDEIELVRELGCSHIQGFIYGKPMPNGEVHRQLNDGQGKAVAAGYRASRSPRTRVLRSSSAEIRGKAHKVLIRNISATGAMIEGLEELEADADVLIELLEDQMFPAKVRWSEENRAGLEFARSFDLERFNAASALPSMRKAANG